MEEEDKGYREEMITFAYISSAVAALLALYRLAVMMFIGSLDGMMFVAHDASVVAAFGSISMWLGAYGLYKSSVRETKDQFEYAYSLMKTLSLLAGVCCILHIIFTIPYFLQQGSINFVTEIYVFIEQALWFVLAVFFFLFWNYIRQKAKRIDEQVME